MIVAGVQDDEVDHVAEANTVSQVSHNAGEQQRTSTENAIVVSEKQFADLRRRAMETNLREVEMLLEAHALVLRDEAFRMATRERIQTDGMNAEWALKETVKKIKQIFDGLDDD